MWASHFRCGTMNIVKTWAGKPEALFTLLNCHIVNSLLTIYVYIYRLVLFSALIRKLLIQRVTVNEQIPNSLRISHCKHWAKRGTAIVNPHPEAQKALQKRMGRSAMKDMVCLLHTVTRCSCGGPSKTPTKSMEPKIPARRGETLLIFLPLTKE